jgi:hypothetical protein
LDADNDDGVRLLKLEGLHMKSVYQKLTDMS